MFKRSRRMTRPPRRFVPTFNDDGSKCWNDEEATEIITEIYEDDPSDDETDEGEDELYIPIEDVDESSDESSDEDDDDILDENDDDVLDEDDELLYNTDPMPSDTELANEDEEKWPEDIYEEDNEVIEFIYEDEDDGDSSDADSTLTK